MTEIWTFLHGMWDAIALHVRNVGALVAIGYVFFQVWTHFGKRPRVDVEPKMRWFVDRPKLRGATFEESIGRRTGDRSQIEGFENRLLHWERSVFVSVEVVNKGGSTTAVLSVDFRNRSNSVRLTVEDGPYPELRSGEARAIFLCGTYTISKDAYEKDESVLSGYLRLHLTRGRSRSTPITLLRQKSS